jgi:hypothetical protein
MRTLAIGCVVVATLFSTAAFSRGGGGGMGMHHSASTMGTPTTTMGTPTTGGAFGASPFAPGTNSSGTALAGGGSGVGGGPALGTGNAAVDQEDRKAERMLSSICKGC